MSKKKEKDNILSVTLIKKGNKLIHELNSELVIYQEFVNALEENQRVEVFFEANKDTGTNVQLAKIHACIRKLSQELGYTFEEMKLEVKRQCGLCWERDNDTYCKSFAACSTEELGLAIEAIVAIGEQVNINFRQKITQD